jgi:hypothetical protein
MKLLKGMGPWMCLALLVALPLGTAKADDYNKLTIFTFSAPVELPGVAALPTGTYAFQLMNSQSDRNIVQVFNKDRTKLYATVMTIPDYRLEPTDKTVIRFSETAAGGPPAIKEWFYPGDKFGQEFVYPKSRAVELAKASNQAVPSMPDNLKSDITTPAKTSTAASVEALNNAPIKAEQPGGGEVEVAEAFLAKPDQQSSGENTTHNVNTEAASNSNAKLPKTASMLPLFGLMGILFTTTGAILWVMVKPTT